MRKSTAVLPPLFLFLLLLPLLHLVGIRLPATTLGGETLPEAPVVWDWEKLQMGITQKRIEKWFRNHSGVLGYLIKTDNQINFSVFDQVSANYAPKVIKGREHHLIERAYLKSINTRGARASRLLERAAQLKQLQDALQSRGIGFLVVISPNKVSIHPELVPRKYKRARSRAPENSYVRMRTELDRLGVAVFDGHRYFRDQKRASPYTLFASSGTHWNEYGACLVAQNLVQRLELQLGQALRKFTCTPVTLSPIPSYPDRELTRIINLWFPSSTYTHTPLPQSRTLIDGGEARPKMLFVGTSFSWPLLRYLDQHQIYRERDFLYYFKRRDHYPSGRSTPVDRDQTDWRSEILEHDAIILEVNEAYIHRIGYGFLPTALSALLPKSSDPSDVHRGPRSETQGPRS